MKDASARLCNNAFSSKAPATIIRMLSSRYYPNLLLTTLDNLDNVLTRDAESALSHW